MAILNHAQAGTLIPELRWEHGVFYKWRTKYGGIVPWLWLASKSLKRRSDGKKVIKPSQRWEMTKEVDCSLPMARVLNQII